MAGFCTLGASASDDGTGGSELGKTKEEPHLSLESADGQLQPELLKSKHACYYGGGLSCILQFFLAFPMLYFGSVYQYDCPGARFIPILIHIGGVAHLFLSLPFSGLLLHAMFRMGFSNVKSGKIFAALSPVAR